MVVFARSGIKVENSLHFTVESEELERIESSHDCSDRKKSLESMLSISVLFIVRACE